MDGPSPWESNNGSATAIAQRGAGGPDLTDYARTWHAKPGALISGFSQFTVNNQVLVAWDDQSADAIRLLPTGSPRGKISPNVFSTGPDAALSAVRLVAGDTFAADPNAMSVLDLAKWTLKVRIKFEISGSGVGRFCGLKHDTIASGIHIAYDYGTTVLSMNAPGTVDGSIDLAEAIIENEGYTLFSRYDGVDHKVDLFDKDGVLLESKTAPHSGTATNGDDFIIHDNVKAAQIRNVTAYNRDLSDEEMALLAANSLTDNLPGA